jgi:hypothetical protein
LSSLLFVNITTVGAAAAEPTFGPIANLQYVHNFVARATGITVPVPEGNIIEAPAYVQYLLAVIDATNRRSTGSIETNYKDDPLATDIAIPVQNVWDATARLFNCKAAGYYKSGAVDPNTGLGNVSCDPCPKDNYCLAGENTTTSCSMVGTGYVTDAEGATSSVECHEDWITSAEAPDLCEAFSEKDHKVYNCTKNNVNGVAVTEFVVGAYCSTKAGEGSYSSPAINDGCGEEICKEASLGAGTNCYCKIHSVNGIAVVPSTAFVFFNTNGGSLCKTLCSGYCTSYSQSSSDLRSVLFDAIGE